MIICEHCGNSDYDFINFKKKIIICSNCQKNMKLK